MDKSRLAEQFQHPRPNLLMNVAILASQKKDIIDLSIGDPDVITDQHIIEAAYKKVKAGATKYTAPSGDPAFLQAVVDYYRKKHGLLFKPEQVRATVGATHALYLALQVILDPGDEVIIHEPFFTPYKEQVLLAGGTPVIVPTHEEQQFQLLAQDLAAAVTKKTKAILINSPNNPTGVVFTEETLKAIAEIAVKNDLFILADEIYEDFTYGKPFVPLARLAPKNTITISGLSKAFAMTGWRIGYLIAPTYVNEVAGLVNEGVTYSAPTASQHAGIYALNHYEDLIPPLVKIFEERLTYVKQRVAKIPYLSMLPELGSLYAYLNISKTGLSAVDFVETVLAKTGVLFVPGDAFSDQPGTTYVRLAATQPLEVLAKAFDRLEKLKF